MTTAISSLLAAAALATQATPAPQIRMAPAPAIAPVRVEGTCAAVPMRRLNHIPVVDVTIRGRTYVFAIDTGAQGHGRISPELASTLGLTIAGQARTPGPGGTVASRPIYALDALSLGSVTFRDLQLLEAAPTRGLNAGWDGILGIDLFQALTLALDYGNSVAAVRQAPLAGGVAASFPRSVPVIPIEIAGRRFEIHLDTGNGAAPLFLRTEDAQGLPLSGEPVERGRARTSFGEFAIMEAPLGAPVTIGGYALPVRSVGWPGARDVGNLGSRGLDGTLVEVDRRAGRVSISASGAAPACAG